MQGLDKFLTDEPNTRVAEKRITLAPDMGKKEDSKVLQAHLTPDEYKEYHALVEKKKWSDKKLNEEIIRLFLKEVKKNPNRLNDL